MIQFTSFREPIEGLLGQKQKAAGNNPTTSNISFGSAGRTQTGSTLRCRFRIIAHFVEDCACLVFYTVYTPDTLGTPLCLSCDRHLKTIINRYIHHPLHGSRARVVVAESSCKYP